MKKRFDENEILADIDKDAFNETKIFYLDGIPVKIIKKKPEMVESQIMDSEEQDILPQSELKEVIAELNMDKLNSEGMSPIDLKTNLSSIEKTAYHAFDALITLGFLPKSASSISRIGKRLNVSLHGGRGRKDIVDIVGRNNEKKKNMLANAVNIGKPPN